MEITVAKNLNKINFNKFYLRLKQESFNPLEKSRNFLELSNQCGYLHVIILDETKEIVGYFVITPNQSKRAVIDRFLIFNKFRGKGISRAVLNKVFNDSDFKFFVVEPIVPAIKYWEKMGFTKSDRVWVKAK